MTNSTLNFKELLNETNDGIFSVGVKTSEFDVEIHVNYGAQEIKVLFFKGLMFDALFHLTQDHYSLHGMFGKPSVAKKFNQIIEELSK